MDLFSDHLSTRIEKISNLIHKWKKDCLIIESGQLIYHFQDDQFYPFKEYPYFRYLCPAKGSGHFLFIKPGEKPLLYYYKPADFWHDHEDPSQNWWSQYFQIETYGSMDELPSFFSRHNKNSLIIGDRTNISRDKDLLKLQDIEANQLPQLHWLRSQKTPYEIHCLERANEIAAKGHKAAREAFFSGLSEKQISFKYQQACQQMSPELPYSPIIALNEKPSVLHYHGSRDEKPTHSFLIDAGATFEGYGSDITRTYSYTPDKPFFGELIEKVDVLQKKLCALVKPKTDYIDLHSLYCKELCQLLVNTEILKGISSDDAYDLNLFECFFPHGLGHPLGIQVHDVAGKQLDEMGQLAQSNKKFPFLRTLRTIQANDVLTIEPGLYFIPMLLDKKRNDKDHKTYFNWTLIESLIPYGGIRIEDNVQAKESNPYNITRKFLP